MGEVEKGDTQGDPASSMRFCLEIHPSLHHKAGGGMARGGTAHVVLLDVEEFAREVNERCLFHWERTKSVYLGG